jgi:hypothetical protein
MGRKMKIYRNAQGTCINIGEWDDKDGLNPLPADAVESDEEVIVGWDGGRYVHDDPKAIKS